MVKDRLKAIKKESKEALKMSTRQMFILQKRFVVIFVFFVSVLVSGNIEAKVIYEEDFEKYEQGEDLISCWVTNAEYEIHYAGVTDEKVLKGKKSLKLDITLKSGSHCYFALKMDKIPCDKELILGAYMYVEVIEEGVKVGIGRNFIFPPAKPTGCLDISVSEKTDEWKYIVDSKLLSTGKKIMEDVKSVFPEDFEGVVPEIIMDKWYISITGKFSGQNVVVYIDEVKVTDVEDKGGLLKDILKSGLFPAIGSVAETKNPPVIDGKLNDESWKDSYKFSNFTLLNQTIHAKEQTTGSILFDEKNLYIGLHCNESKMDSITTNVSKRDVENIWTDDCIEIFVIPPESEFLNKFSEDKRYFHFIFNAIGTQYDEVGISNPTSWDAKWVGKTFHSKDYWEVEISIPFDSLYTKLPKLGKGWALNLCRSQPRLKENSSWSPVYTSFHDYKHFGKVIFSKEESLGAESFLSLLKDRIMPKLTKVQNLISKVSSILDSISARASKSKIISNLEEGINELNKRADEIQEEIDTKDANLLLVQAKLIEMKIFQLNEEVRKLQNTVLVLTNYNKEQLDGEVSLPQYFIFPISNYITNDKYLPFDYPENLKPAVPLDAVSEISVFASPSEYEPVSFIIYTLKDLKNVKIKVNDLKSKKGVIKAENLDVKVVKCWYQSGKEISETKDKILVPELLLKDDKLVEVDMKNKINIVRGFSINTTTKERRKKDILLVDTQSTIKDADELQPVDIPSNTSKQFWLTVYVPEGTPAGNYRGDIEIQVENVKISSLKFCLEVLPIRLLKPCLEYSIYYRGILANASISSENKSEEQFLAEMKNMKAHGIDNPTVYQSMDFVLLKKVFELREKAGITGVSLLSLGLGTGEPKTPGELEDLKEKTKALVNFAKKNKVTDVYIYGIDEAIGELLRREREGFQAVHEAGGKVFVACYKGFYELVGDLLDLPIMNGPIAHNVEDIHKKGYKIYCYANPQVGNEEPLTYRRNFGLYLWKAGFDGAMDYAYQHSFNHIWDDFDNVSYRDHVFAYPTINGVIDTIQWEGFREGVDDVRYLTTLKNAIENSKKSKKEEIKFIAEKAEDWLDNIDINSDLQELRRIIAEWIIKLQF